MTLDRSYLDYPKRGYGMDHDLYPFSNLFERPQVDWGEGRRLAVLIAPVVEYFPLVPAETPFPVPGHMVTPYPDLRHYTAREYGTRVGIFRFLRLFEQLGISASVPINAAIAERYPFLVEKLLEGGHELIGHGCTMNDLHYGGMDRQREADLIGRALESLERASGRKIRGWLSVAHSESANTASLLAAAGVRYLCDWSNDDLPYAMTTPEGPILSLPLNHELSDQQIIGVCQHSEIELVEQIRDQADRLLAETERFGGRLFTFKLTPYVTGQPFRIRALESALRYVVERSDAWPATASEILDAWEAPAGPAQAKTESRAERG